MGHPVYYLGEMGRVGRNTLVKMSDQTFVMSSQLFTATSSGQHHNVCKTVWLSEAVLVIRLLKYALKKWITIGQILVKTAIFDVKKYLNIK
jgi:hypothetical protein